MAVQYEEIQNGGAKLYYLLDPSSDLDTKIRAALDLRSTEVRRVPTIDDVPPNVFELEFDKAIIETDNFTIYYSGFMPIDQTTCAVIVPKNSALPSLVQVTSYSPLVRVMGIPVIEQIVISDYLARRGIQPSDRSFSLKFDSTQSTLSVNGTQYILNKKNGAKLYITNSN